MSKEPRGLGKGLSALLGDVPVQEQFRKPVGYVNKDLVTDRTRGNAADILRIPVDLIEPNPFQPRLSFDQAALDELTDSIKTLGLIQPITVRKINEGRFQIISGERRFKACRLAGMLTVPAYVREANDQGMLEMAIVENVQRENLDPIELAMSYQRLIDDCSLTQDEMADRVGKKRATVANTLRLLRLPAKVQHDIKVGVLSAGHAKALLGVESPEIQEQLCDIAVRDDLSVRQLEELVRKMNGRKKTSGQRSAAASTRLPEEYDRVKEQFGLYFSNSVTFRRNSKGKGTMTIHFDSDDEVRKFLEALEKGRS